MRDSTRLKPMLRSVLAAAALTAGLLAGGSLPSASAAPGPACDRAELLTTELGTYYYIPASRAARDWADEVKGDRYRCWLRQGASGPAVRALQDMMVKCYGKSVPVDGVFGSVTRQALMDVQRAQRIVVDGVYGPQTADALSFPYYDKKDLGSSYVCSHVIYQLH